MGLNDIRLTDSALTALYAKSLVETDNTSTTKSNAPVTHEPTIAIKQSTTEKPNENIAAVEEQISSLKPVIAQEWKHLGDNKKNILVAVNYAQFTHLPDEELNFLTAILSACQLTLGDVSIINQHNFNNISYSAILKHYNSRTILLFGIEPAVFGLPVSFPEFQVQTFDSNKYLFAPSLQECRNDKLIKSKLWVCLRSIFGIQ